MSVTPDDHRRLDAIEHRLAIAEARDHTANERFDRIEGKLDRLLTAAAMGKGAWWAVTKLGGVLVTLVGGLLWAADHFHWWQK